VQVERGDDEQPEGEDEYYDSALVGCQVREVSGAEVGAVKEIAHLPAQDLLVIAADDGRELLVPFIREFVTSVDLAQRVITVSPPPGLFDSDA
jgi:16S rRNA processing protein RimM